MFRLRLVTVANIGSSLASFVTSNWFILVHLVYLNCVFFVARFPCTSYFLSLSERRSHDATKQRRERSKWRSEIELQLLKSAIELNFGIYIPLRSLDSACSFRTPTTDMTDGSKHTQRSGLVPLVAVASFVRAQSSEDCGKMLTGDSLSGKWAYRRIRSDSPFITELRPYLCSIVSMKKEYCLRAYSSAFGECTY